MLNLRSYTRSFRRFNRLGRQAFTHTVALWLVATSLPGVSVAAQELPYYLRVGGLYQTIGNSNFFSFDPSVGFTVSTGLRFASGWELGGEYSSFRLSNDETADSTMTLIAINNNADADFKVSRLGLRLNRMFFEPGNRFNLLAGLQGGVMIWEVIDNAGDTALNVTSDRAATVDFSASELFGGGSFGIRYQPSRNLAFDLAVHGDYLTGAGAEFSQLVKDSRDQWLFGSTFSLNFFFGSMRTLPPNWSQIRQQSGSFAQPLQREVGGVDSDGDGVPDRGDRCHNSPSGVIVDQFGCPLDGDRDGVYDGLDDCPNTERAGSVSVDIYGCAVDTDFDGIPDYRDNCIDNPIGAVVDTGGCPLDEDVDGVPDGLDDCPETLPGMEVDKHGCIDLVVLSAPVVLNIDYVSGSFEIDPHNQKRLKKLSGLLNFLKDYKIEINGYTDNVGTEAANRKLAKKRANRVRDFLVNFNVGSERIKVFGKGEKNFVASNQTAEGRAKNRRIEILFHK